MSVLQVVVLGVFLTLVVGRLWYSFKHGLQWPLVHGRSWRFPWEAPNGGSVYVAFLVLIYVVMVTLQTGAFVAFILGVLFSLHILRR